MNAHLIGIISGVFVVGSSIPYLLVVARGGNKPQPLSWILWAIIGFTMMVTYKSSGASDSFYAVGASFLNPLLVLGLIFFQRLRTKEKIVWEKLDLVQMACLALAMISLGLWLAVRDNPHLSTIALYISLLADVGAAIPTIRHLLSHPEDDVPGPWGIFVLGYGIALFAITDHTISNYSLPVYMIVTYGVITFITARYRIKTRAPLQQWI